MTFLYPLGLLGLIGIPILIIIYIIKNKYTEQTVSSTYIWTLSERFLKRRNPIKRLAGIISLILQILIVAVVSFAIAHPIVVIPDAADEYCFILDASGSMCFEQANGTRLEVGKAEIASIIEDSVNGSEYTLISVGETTNVIYENETNKEKALLLLDEIGVSHVSNDYANALAVAQEHFNANPSMDTYLVTDKEYDTHTNIRLINVSDGEENYAVSDITYTYEDGKLSVFGKAISYESDAELTLELYVDDGTSPVAKQTVSAQKLVETDFTLVHSVEAFYSFKAIVKNADALALDNETTVFNVNEENSYHTLLVSDDPDFLRMVIESVSNASVKVMKTAEYTGQKGYGLYVFDCFTPSTMPADGAVWLVNLTSNLENSGFSVQSQETLGREGPGELTLTNSTASTTKKLIAEMTGKDLYLFSYVKYGLYGNFTTLLSYKGNPVVFTGTTKQGNREVVFAFDLHNSNFPVTGDFVALTRNLLRYSFPETLEKASYVCGEKLEINLPANCENVKIISPTGQETYPQSSDEVGEYAFNEVGVYEIILTIGGSDRTFHVFAEMPKAERASTVTEGSILLQGEAEEGGLDGIYDNLLILFIALAVLFIADWGVYCYDKYQLR